MLAGVQGPLRASLASDVMRAWRNIEHGVTPKTEADRQKYWTHWCIYAKAWNREPFLKNETQFRRNIVVTAFASRVRTGFYGLGNQVKVQTVTTALTSISKTSELAGQQSPIYRSPNTYQLPIERMVEGMRRDDPMPTPQLAVPVGVPEKCHEMGNLIGSEKAKAEGDLALIAFYYLLRVGEYTKIKYIRTSKGKRRKATRTVQFRVKDVGFFADDCVINSKTASLELLLQASSATLRIENQKNGNMGDAIHHEAIPNIANGPTQALARRVHHILSNGGNKESLICDYYEDKTWSAVTSRNMIARVRSATKALNLHQKGIDPDMVGAHSIRAGGAMAMKLHGCDETTIMKMGRWRSLTFLMYIHSQIAHLSKDVSKKMNSPLPFLNISSF
jgi:hypothetical protein